MHRFVKIIVFCSVISFFHFSFVNANLTFSNQDAAFTVAGGSLNIVNPIAKWNGTLRLISGSITGNPVNFNEGGFKNNQGFLETTGRVTPQAQPIIMLTGNQKVLGMPGVLISSLNVLGSGNLLVGQPDFTGTSTLLNSFSELQINITNRLGQSILMNNGLITLLNDLTLGDNTVFTGSGRINLNYKTLKLPAKETLWTSQLYFSTPNDIVLSSKTALSGTWTFDGANAVLNGNGNILDLTSGGSLWIKSGAEVQCTDIHIRGLGNIYGSIIFEDATSRIRLSNATLQLASNYSVTQGGIYIEGGHSLIITGTNILTIATGASMTVDRVTVYADTLDSTATVNVVPNIPDNQKLIYLNHGILRAQDPTDGLLSIANSNAIVGWVKDTSNALIQTRIFVVQNSNAIVQSSNAIVFANSLAVFNSNAIRAVSRGVTHNSNALVSWAKDTSNVMVSTYNLVVQSSNAIVQSSNAIVFANSLAVFNSNAIRAVSRGVTHNSNAIVSWIKDTSNAVAGLMVDMSNSIVASGGNALAVDNSNAIIGWIKNTSNAVAGLMVDMSNSIVASGGNALAVDNSNAIIGWIKNTSNAVVTTNNLAVETSYGMVFANSLAVFNSHAIKALSQGITQNSWAIVNLENRVSANSSAIVTMNALAIATSYGLVYAHSLAVFNSNAIKGLSQGITDDSNAIIGWIKDTSNVVNAPGGNALSVANSNAIVGWIKDTSNVMISTYNLVGQNSNAVVTIGNLAVQNSNAIIQSSNAIVFAHSLAVFNSNAIKALSQGITNNSNAIIATNILSVASSNAIVGWIQDTSNVVNAPGGNALSVANSNAIVSWIKDTSQAVAGLMVDMSNSIVSAGGNALATDNSNAIIGWIQNTSNIMISTYNLVVQNSYAVVHANQLAIDDSSAIISIISSSSAAGPLLIATSNAVHWARALTEGMTTIDRGPSHIHMNSAMTLSYDLYLSVDHQFFGHVSDVCDGAGHVINFAKNDVVMMTIDAGMTVTFENVRLKGYSDGKILLGTGAELHFGDGCEVELDSSGLIERVWSCLGDVRILGNGHQLHIFDNSSGVLAGQASRVLFSHLTMSGIQDNRLRCMGNEGALLFDDVDLVLSNNYTFTVGSMYFERDVLWTSTMIFRYESPMSSTIDSNASVIFDKQLVWEYYPSILNKYAFIFTDSSARWKLNGNDLFISATGLHLIKGTMIIDDANSFYCDGATLSEAIVIGNGVATDDFNIEILPAAEFTLESGVIDYQNMS